MTDYPRLEVPFDLVTKWEEIEGSCARFYAAAEWGHKQALATPPPEQKSSIDDLIAGCKPLDPEMAEALTTEARWRLFGEEDSATPPPEPPKNCWLDDEPDLFPSPCVFDDPDEVINNCTYARTVKCKTDCKYYRVAAHPEPVQAPPPEPPTDEELLAMRAWSSHSHTFDSDLVDFARAVLERWGR